MKKKRSSKFQYGVRSKSNKVVSEISTIEKNIENKNNRSKVGIFLNFFKKIKELIYFLVILIVFYFYELSFISLFNENTKGAIFDFQLIIVVILFVLTPICLWQLIMNNDSQKIKKKKFELYNFILDSILLVILGYLIVFSEMAENTNMIKTILTKNKNIFNAIVLFLTPIKIYYSIQFFRYSRKEDDRK